MKNLVFFYPKIEDDGLKKTFITYLNFFSNKYNIILITSSSNLKISKKFLIKIKIDYVKSSIFKKINLISNLLCLFKIFKYLDKKTVFFFTR